MIAIYPKKVCYQKSEIKIMSNEEVSNKIDELKREIAQDELFNECMSYGLPNQ